MFFCIRSEVVPCKYISRIVIHISFSRQKKQPRLFLHPGPNSILGTSRQFDIFDKSPTYRAVKVFYSFIQSALDLNATDFLRWS